MFESAVVAEGQTLFTATAIGLPSSTARCNPINISGTPTGMPPKTPWGKPAMGLRTRVRKNKSNKLIVRRRYGRG